MSKILLISNKVFFYRVDIYNYFCKRFKDEGDDFFVFSNEIQKSERQEINFNYQERPFSKSIKHLKELKPDVVILFLHLSDKVLWRLIPFLRTRKISFVYWGHGLNLSDPNNKLKNILFYKIHSLSRSILLYSSVQEKYIKEKNKEKIFIANNALNSESFPVINESKEELKKEFELNFQKVVLFVGRIVPPKKLDVLVDIFQKDMNNFGLLIVGDGITKELENKIKNISNIIYYGPIYDNIKINKLFKLSDIFCIPGKNGLGINQAMYWGSPCLTLSVRHSPEIAYLVEGETGYILNTTDELKNKILEIFNNDELYNKLSVNAENLIKTKANIENMFQGFKSAIANCNRK